MASMQNVTVEGLREVGNEAVTAIGIFTYMLGLFGEPSADLYDTHCSMYESAGLLCTVYGRGVSTDVSSYLQLCSLPDGCPHPRHVQCSRK